MKQLSTLLILLLLCSWSQTVRAQAADSWVTVSPKGERFTIQMPNSRFVESLGNSVGPFKADARIYTATSDGVEYTVWSLVNEGQASSGPAEIDAYLDACADLVWESLLKPLRDQVPKSPDLASYMVYQRDLELGQLPLGREYAITLGNKPGLTQFRVAGKHIYVLTVLYANANSAATQRFMNSFDLKRPGLPVGATIIVDPVLLPPSAGAGGGVGPGRGGNMDASDSNISGGEQSTGVGDSTDYSRVFSTREVTGKARVLSKPEPSYTEGARKYAVQGTVILRAVVSNTGQLVNIRVVKKLPHGLTERAVEAARNISFIAASKDGHAVSMHIQLEYQFNLY